MWAAPALAQAGTKRVGLVVAFPDGTRYADVVTVPADATAFDALKAAKITLVSQETQFGPAVCSINNTGCPATNCFCDPKRFWAYFHLDAATGKWAAAKEGVGAYKPANGAVEGFTWTESDANFNPVIQPPVLTFAQLQAQPAATAVAATTATRAAVATATRTAAAVATTAATRAAVATPAVLPVTGGAPVAALLLAAAALLGAGLTLRRRA